MKPEQSTGERRRFHRFIFDAPVTLTIGDTAYASLLRDISFKGILVERPKGWQAGTVNSINVRIQLDEGLTTIDMETIAVHESSENLGLRCVHIDMESMTHLRRLVELNLADPEMLERELEALG